MNTPKQWKHKKKHSVVEIKIDPLVKNSKTVNRWDVFKLSMPLIPASGKQVLICDVDPKMQVL